MALSNLLTDAEDICLPWGTIQNRKQGEQYPKKEAQGTVRTEKRTMSRMIQHLPPLPMVLVSMFIYILIVFNERFLKWSIYRILELHCSNLYCCHLAGGVLSPSWLVGHQLRGEKLRRGDRNFVYSPWQQMKRGLWETDLSGSAKVYSKV